jgi:transposase
MKQQAPAGDIVLLFADESEASTHPRLARAWAKRGADLRVEAPGRSQEIAIIGALDFVSRQLTVVTSPNERTADFIALLERLDQIHGPEPGAACKPVVIALDNGPIHASKATRAAPEARKHCLTPEWLAKYAPELDDIEHDWKTIKTHRPAHKTFENRDSLQATIKTEIQAISSSRKTQPLAKPRISA